MYVSQSKIALKSLNSLASDPHLLDTMKATGLAVSNESVNDKVDPFFVFIYLFIAH